MRLDGIWTEAQGRLISNCNLEPCIPSSINSNISCRLPGIINSSPSLLEHLFNKKDYYKLIDTSIYFKTFEDTNLCSFFSPCS